MGRLGQNLKEVTGRMKLTNLIDFLLLPPFVDLNYVFVVRSQLQFRKIQPRLRFNFFLHILPLKKLNNLTWKKLSPVCKIRVYNRYL